MTEMEMETDKTGVHSLSGKWFRRLCSQGLEYL
jgi:hypothetical protein